MNGVRAFEKIREQPRQTRIDLSCLLGEVRMNLGVSANSRAELR